MKKTVKIFNRQLDSFVEMQADMMKCDDYLIITPETSLIQLGDQGIIPQIGDIVEVESRTLSIVYSWRPARQRFAFHSGFFFKDRKTCFLGNTWVYGGLVNNNRTFGNV